ncbi:MAG: copper chaperone PCu(A)C [Propionibacteriales bacterium]|nr:copper chaperone PCu(A)C [Propionibacteriales bacterium]
MKPLRAVVSCFLLLALAGVAGCQAGADQSNSVRVQDSYAKVMPKGTMSAIFGVITNDTDADVTFESASGDVAAAIELHEMVSDGGTMIMRKKEGGFVVRAGESLTLDPGGLHIMLIGLKQDLKAGDKITVTLNLAGGGTVDVEAVARDMANAQESYDPEAQSDDEGGGGSTGALAGSRPVR